MAVLRFAGGTFTFRRWPTLITLLMGAALVGLGTWQVERLSWKANLILTIKTRMSEEPVDAASPVVGEPEYHPAKVSGTFLHDKEMYVIAISLNGDGGYHVLTPLRFNDGRILLVDRGWIPYSARSVGDRQGTFSHPAGRVNIKGLLRVPHHRWMQPADRPERNEWYGVDLAAMASSAGLSPFLPFVLETDATPNTGGYPVGGQTRVELPNNHFVYALTWYGLAVILIVIYGVSGWKRNKKS